MSLVFEPLPVVSARSTGWLPENPENDGITWPCLEKEGHTANPG